MGYDGVSENDGGPSSASLRKSSGAGPTSRLLLLSLRVVGLVITTPGFALSGVVKSLSPERVNERL